MAVRHQHSWETLHDLNNGGFLVHRIVWRTKMRQKSETQVQSSEQVVKDTRRATRKQYSAEEKFKIVLDGFRGEYSIAAKCAT
jgi:transposase